MTKEITDYYLSEVNSLIESAQEFIDAHSNDEPYRVIGHLSGVLNNIKILTEVLH